MNNSKKIKTKSPAAQFARKLLRFLAGHKETLSPLLILTHDFPDPDALAGAFALNYLTERFFGIQSRIAYSGIIGRVENRSMVQLLKLPVHKLRPTDLKRYENVALIDTQPEFKNNPFPPQRRASIIIDQHPYVTKPLADLTIVDTECGATCVILAEALLQMKTQIPSRIATALAYGILTDTMNLYRARREDVTQVYLKILPFCDMKVLAKIQNPARSKRFFTTLVRGIQHAMMRKSLVVSHLGAVESPDLVSQVADFLLTYKGAERALCTGQFHNRLHVSLRLERSVTPAADILRDVFINAKDAGGHDSIAGGSFLVAKTPQDQDWADAENGIVERIVKRLRLGVKGEFYHPFRQVLSPKSPASEESE